MKQYVVINQQTCEIVNSYITSNDLPRIHAPYDDPETWVHVEIPLQMPPAFLRAAHENGKWVFMEDQPKKRKHVAEQLEHFKYDVRQKRNRLLAECDWTVSASDAPLTDVQKTEWKKYRQLLRDITKTIDAPGQDIHWPVPPK